MAPHKRDRDAQIETVISFASGLRARAVSSTCDAILTTDIRREIARSVPLLVAARPPHAERLDTEGTELWNSAIRLRRGDDALETRQPSEDGIADVACLLRVLAVLLINGAWLARFSYGTPDRRDYGSARRLRASVRVMKITLKAGSTCVARGEVELAMLVLERAASLVDEVGRGLPDVGSESADNFLAARLRVKYYILRTAFAWKQSRMDIAEHMFQKAELDRTELDPVSAEDLADTLSEIGRDLLQKRLSKAATLWLERAYDILGGQEVQHLSPNSSKLKASIMHSLIRALLAQKSTDTKERAVGYVSLMEADFSDSLVVPMLKLEILTSAGLVDAEQYYNNVLRLSRSAILNSHNMKMLMHHVHKLKATRPDLVVKVLDELLTQRLLVDPDREEWIEKVLVTRLWVTLEATTATDSIQDLEDLLSCVFQASRQPLRVPATHATHTLVWKGIEASFTANRFEECEDWCKICLHPLLANGGEINAAKIARKRIMCALGKGDLSSARQVYCQMPQAGMDAPMTRYLMYKVALRDGDAEFAAENLEVICTASSQDAKLLYACVLDTQTAGDKQQTAAALQKILELYDTHAPTGVHLPALLRCTARLLMGELKDDEPPDPKVIDELCKVYDAAVTHAQKENQRRDSERAQLGFGEKELQWFSRSSYNLATKHCASIQANCLIHLLTSCHQLLNLLIDVSLDDDRDEVKVRAAFCLWLLACADVVVARAEENMEASNQAYLMILKCGKDFRSQTQDLTGNKRLSEDVRNDLTEKHLHLIKLELEAALKLRRWDDLDPLFELCWGLETVSDAQWWDSLADLVLVIHAEMAEAAPEPSRLAKVRLALQSIINVAQRGRDRSGDAEWLARWLRCLFQLAAGTDSAAGLRCLEQAHVEAQRRRGTTQALPRVELEWLAATAFNTAVDHYSSGDDVGARVWADKALMLAGDVEDEGALLGLLREKYSGLSWDAE